MNDQEIMEYIEYVSGLGIVPGLDSIRELLKRMGNPQKELAFVHIAGTNGKGSVLAYISTILKEAGYKVGRYLSPVIFEYREKIQVNEKMISKKALGEGISMIREICTQMQEEGLPHPTVFEIETALAFWYFKEKKVDIVVLETGMGGLMDATNVVENTLVAVLVSIGMDHMQFLGDTLEKIATQKAGIIKENCLVASMENPKEVLQIIENTASQKNAPLTVVSKDHISHVKYGLKKQQFDYAGFKKLEVQLAGNFQVINAALAVKVVQLLGQKGYPVNEAAIRKGLLNTVWRGRFTVLSQKPLFITDGAHNIDAAEKLIQSIEFYFTNRRIIYIMGMLKDKDVEKVIEMTHSYADQIITVTTPNAKRTLSAFELASMVAKVHPNVTAVDSMEEAVEMSKLLCGKEDVILAFGSLSFQGKLMEIVDRDGDGRKRKA